MSRFIIPVQLSVLLSATLMSIPATAETISVNTSRGRCVTVSTITPDIIRVENFAHGQTPSATLPDAPKAADIECVSSSAGTAAHIHHSDRRHRPHRLDHGSCRHQRRRQQSCKRQRTAHAVGRTSVNIALHPGQRFVLRSGRARLQLQPCRRHFGDV